MDDHDTETVGMDDHKTNSTNEPEQNHLDTDVSQILQRIWNQGVEQTKEEFEYINLQGKFSDIDPCSTTTKETIVCIKMSNERKNYYNTMHFIADEARKDQMINDYILTQHILKAGLRKFEEKDHNATVKELQ